MQIRKNAYTLGRIVEFQLSAVVDLGSFCTMHLPHVRSLNYCNTLVWMQAPGMLSMMRELGIQPLGSHHLGIDDSKNIARVLKHLLTDGAILQITAKRAPGSPVRFLFQNRIT